MGNFDLGAQLPHRHEIDFDEANVGLGLRYYFNHLVFVEVDALRNSNGGLAVPVSAGLDLKVASLGRPATCTPSLPEPSSTIRIHGPSANTSGRDPFQA